MCNITEGVVGWSVNSDNTVTLTDIRRGGIPGHTANGSNLVVVNATNNTQYMCVSISITDVLSDPVYLYVAGTFDHNAMYIHTCIGKIFPITFKFSIARALHYMIHKYVL